MSDRTLVTYLEDRRPDGPYWRLEVQRSAAGRPGGLVTIQHDSVDGSLPTQEMTVVVDDLRRLWPAIIWANGDE